MGQIFFYFHKEPLPKTVIEEMLKMKLELKDKVAKVLGAPIGLNPKHVRELASDEINVENHDWQS